jgi:hypothetical protein
MITLVLRAIPNLDKPPVQFQVDLLDGSYAVLSLVKDHVWAVVEHRRSAPAIDHGLFGTPEDAVEMLRAALSARDATPSHGDPQTAQSLPGY